MSNPSAFLSALALAAACSMAPMVSCAADSPSPRADGLPDWAPQPKPRVAEELFRVEVQLLGASYDTQLRIDPSLQTRGTLIDAEDDLGLDDSELLPMAEITLLPGERHLIRLSGLTTHRSAQTQVERRIEFEDEVYLIGERVDSELDLTLVGLTYGFRFIQRERAELTGTFGVQVAQVDANSVVRSRVVREEESGVAPLPLLGLEGRIDLFSRWSFEGRAQYLTAEVEEVDGEMLDLRAAFTWRLNPHLVFGVGYRRLEIEVDSRDEGTPGFADISIDGPLLFMRASI